MKEERTRLIEESMGYQEELKITQEKREQEKKMVEEQKVKFKASKQSFKEQEARYRSQVEGLEQEVRALKSREPREDARASEVQMEKDMRIARLETEAEELVSRFNEAKSQNARAMVEISNLKDEVAQQSQQVKVLQEKRQYAIDEIKRLNVIITSLKEQAQTERHPHPQA